MKCKKCKRGTCIKVTAVNPRTTTERRGIVWAIVTAPFRLFRWFFRLFLVNQRQKSDKRMMWKCNYCGATFRDESWGRPEDETISSETLEKMNDGASKKEKRANNKKFG